MEGMVALAIGVMTASGVYLVLRQRSFPVIVGLSMLSYAVNVFLFASGRLSVGMAPVISGAAGYADPLPQALVLTAIVISFGMTAVIVMMALGAYLHGGDDRVDMGPVGDGAPPTPIPFPRGGGEAHPFGASAPSEGRNAETTAAPAAPLPPEARGWGWGAAAGDTSGLEMDGGEGR